MSYTNVQIQEAIAALERESPGIWETMKRLASNDAPPNEEHEIALTAVVRVSGKVYPRLSFIAQAADKNGAIQRLNLNVGNTLRAQLRQEKATT